ncbi:MAG: methyltransferase domain-containing protein [Acidobacteriota bacterium]
MKNKKGILVFLALLLSPALLFVQEWHFDVPYVPTRPEVVAGMLETAGVGKNDVLYDLGCGDGRIVITAAKLYGTRGVGVDINPERIKESRANAAQAGVSDLVKFLEQDLFQTDFHEATVLTLYLLSSVNLRLRPLIFDQLRPGSRVVSHDFSMEDWLADRTEVVELGAEAHNVYFWVVPANASGVWAGAWTEGGLSFPFKIAFEQRFQVASGRMAVGDQELALKDVIISGDRIRFSVETESAARRRTMNFDGRLTRDIMEGGANIAGERKQGAMRWKAERNPATMTRLDSGALGR